MRRSISAPLLHVATAVTTHPNIRVWWVYEHSLFMYQHRHLVIQEDVRAEEHGELNVRYVGYICNTNCRRAEVAPVV